MRSTFQPAHAGVSQGNRGVAAKYPDDDEAQIAYAITLNTSASPADKTYAQQTKGAAILEPISKRLPQHPGVTHYLIHLYDYPATAEKGLDAANRYAKIAPAAPHAQHMPSHIYTRVGYWKESDRVEHRLGESGEGGKIGRQLSTCPGLHGLCPPPARPGQAGARGHGRDDAGNDFNAIRPGPLCGGRVPARYAVERGDWDGAAIVGGEKQPVHYATRCRISPERSAPRAPASRTPPAPISPSSPSCATSCCEEGRLLVGDRRHPTTGRVRVGAIRGRQTRRGAQSHEGRRGRRG